MRHGDVRAAILLGLTEGPAHGYEIGQRLLRASGGAWQPSPGSIYPTLQTLSDEDLVTSEEREGKRIWLAGLADALDGSPLPDFSKAIPKTALADGEPVILLAHEPDIAPEAAKHHVDLMLSGHTHGGQVRIPFLPPVMLPPMGKKYVEGAFRVGPMQLYVNRGVGTVQLPFRFNCPPEITVITLA